VSLFFGTMGALENMLEEIIPLVPVLMLLGAGIGVDGVTVVAMSFGASMVGSSFGPSNPFQAGIALKVAQLPPFERGGLRVAMLVAGLAVWIAWTMWHAARVRRVRSVGIPEAGQADQTADVRLKPDATGKHALIMAVALAPMAAYVYGALRFDWGFNE